MTAPAFDIHQGEALALLRRLPAESVDALITDPPYSSGGFTRSDRNEDPTEKYVHSGVDIVRNSFSGDNRDARSFCYWTALWLSEANRVVRDNGYALVFTDWRQLPLTADALQAGGFVWRGVIAWDKGDGARPIPGYFKHQCEYLVWGTKGTVRSLGRVFPGVFRVGVHQADKFHLTGKPTALMLELVQCVAPGALILDPFMGSGTTGVAAIRAGRRFIGFEREPHYFNVALERLEGAAPLMAAAEPEQAALFDLAPEDLGAQPDAGVLDPADVDDEASA